MKYKEVEEYVAVLLSTEDFEIVPAYGQNIFDAKSNAVACLNGGEKDFADYIAFDIDVMLRTSIEDDPYREKLFDLADKTQQRIMLESWNISDVSVSFNSDANWHAASLNFKLHERFDT